MPAYYQINVDFRSSPQRVTVAVPTRGPKGDTGNAGPAGTTDYTQLQNVPATFPPSAHTHVAADVTDFSASASAAAPVQSVAGRTGAVTLAVADVANAVADTDARLSDARTPTAHTHAIADVTNLQTSLDGKAAAVHTHAIADVTNLQAALDGKQTAGNYATLVNGLVPANQLPSYVDDVLEFANLAALPVSGEAEKIYVTLDTNKTYRWSGSAYVEISASPGSTDAVPEGSTNLYFTNQRAADAAPVQSVAGRTGAVTLAVADVANAVATSDARLTDARTPTAHKSSHAAGGSDALTPADIGAAAASHTHTPSEVGLGNVANAAQVTSVTGTAPIVSSGGTTPAISINEATTSAAGSMSAADKLKLDGIAEGAEVNVTADWNASSGDAQILNKPTLGGAAALNVGTTAGTVAAGDDSRFTDAAALTSGTLADARLSANVALEDTANTFTANQTLNGTNNVAPNQTAASGSSIMTRDLVDARFVTPRDRFDVTHFFGVQGLGAFQVTGTTPQNFFVPAGLGVNLSWGLWTNTRIGSNSAGAGMRLGSNASTGGSAFVSSLSGAYIMRGRVGKLFNQGAGAMAFLLGGSSSSAMWHANSLGLYYVPQPTATWAATTAYLQHDRINVGGVVWAASTAGTTGAAEPAWTNTIDGTLTDGTVVWRNCGPHTSNEWAFALGGTDSSAIVLQSTGKAGWTTSRRADVVLTLRFGGQTSSPYLFFASVENAAGPSAEVSVSTNTNLLVSPQFWSRNDGNALAVESGMSLRYYTQQVTQSALL